MKPAVSIALLAATLAFTGCNTYVGVDNPDQSSSTYSTAAGSLVTRYKASPEAVFNAVKRAIGEVRGHIREHGAKPAPAPLRSAPASPSGSSPATPRPAAWSCW